MELFFQRPLWKWMVGFLKESDQTEKISPRSSGEEKDSEVENMDAQTVPFIDERASHNAIDVSITELKEVSDVIVGKTAETISSTAEFLSKVIKDYKLGERETYSSLADKAKRFVVRNPWVLPAGLIAGVLLYPLVTSLFGAVKTAAITGAFVVGAAMAVRVVSWFI